MTHNTSFENAGLSAILPLYLGHLVVQLSQVSAKTGDSATKGDDRLQS